VKRCPTCERGFSDDSLRFCLYDGAALSDVETAGSASGQDGAGQPGARPDEPQSPQRRRSRSLLLFLGAILLGGFFMSWNLEPSEPAIVPDPSVLIPELVDALRYGSEAEAEAGRTFDTTRLSEIYGPEPLSYVTTAIESLRADGLFKESVLEMQQIEAVRFSDDQQQAQVRMTEGWRSTVFSLATGRCVARIPSQRTPQTVTLERRGGRWMIMHVEFPPGASAPTPQPC
jgi:hypothetical protein